MLGKAFDEALGSLRRMSDYSRSTPQEPLEPARESPPQNNINQVAVAPRTPNTTGGGSSRAQCADGDGTVFPAQDVRFKQGKLKAEATPAGDRLETKEEQHFVQAGAIAFQLAPYPLQMGVFCLPFCHL